MQKSWGFATILKFYLEKKKLIMSVQREVLEPLIYGA